MYHLKSNKTIVFESYLSMEYDYILEQNFFINADNCLASIDTVNFVGYYYLNGVKMKKPITLRIYQGSSILIYPQISHMISNSQQLEDSGLKLDIEKISNALNSPSKNNDTLLTLVKGLNYRFKEKPYLPLKLEILNKRAVKDYIYDIFSNLKKGKLFYDEYSPSFQ